MAAVSSRPSPLVVAVAVFLIAVTSFVLVSSCTRRQPPANCAELADELHSLFPSAQIVPAGRGADLEAGFYVTLTPKSRRELDTLPLRADAIEKWRGVLHVRRVDAAAVDVRLMGEYVWVEPPFLVFGDADMLRQVAARR